LPPAINFKLPNINNLCFLATLASWRLKYVQKKLKKLLTGDTVSGIVVSHTVNVEQQHNTENMKKTLLITAAALVAGIVSTEAQVYSANIVGYANVVLTGAPTAQAYTLIANPLDDGNGNQLTNIIGGLPAGSSITTWAGTVFNTPIGKTAGGWSSSTALPPGVGFFVKNGKASPVSPPYTNTFVGTVGAVGLATGGTVTNALALGYNLVGSQIAFAGDLTTDPNLNLQVPAQSSLTDWNPSTQTYDTPVGKTAGGWAGPFVVTVGEGFFVKEGKYATNWVQTLP
jgi:hypothetical protein